MSTDPYGFFDDARDSSTSRTRVDATSRGRWLDDVRTTTELPAGMQGDGHQRVLRSADGHIVIYNSGTINFNRRESLGGVDYRDGDRSQDFRDAIPYARDQRLPRNPQTFSVGDSSDDFSEEQFDRWQYAYMQRLNQNNLAQRNFSGRTYPQQLFGPQAEGWGPRPYQPFQQNGFAQALDSIGRVALPLAAIYAASRGGGGGLLALELSGGGGYGGGFTNPNYLYGNQAFLYGNQANNPNYLYGNQAFLYGNQANNPNYLYNRQAYLYGNQNISPVNYQVADNGAYYDGGLFPGTYSNFQGAGTQWVPNNAYAWQRATMASMNYGRQPFANLPPGYYGNSSLVASNNNDWSSDYSYI